LTLADHALSHLGDDAQHARGDAGVIGKRRVGEGVIGLLGEPAALKIET
jgi:hypothetical protein